MNKGEKIISELKKHNYIVEKAGDNNYKFTGNNVHGYIFNSSEVSKIVADHVNCFDEPVNCPLQCNLKDVDIESLIEALKFLGTDEGFKISNS
jgi:hypothetical protein